MPFEKLTYLQENYRDNETGNVWVYGRVIDNKDPLDSYRIRVRIKGIDDKLADAELPWCEPLVPIYFSVVPKIDELVKIFPQNWSKPLMARQWVGPIISSVQALNNDGYLTALSNTDVSSFTPTKAIGKIPSATGAYIDKIDIGFQGRNNTDLVFKDKEVLIRAGKFVYNDNTTLNKNNPAYIQLKLSQDGQISYGGIVANKIYLITHEGKTNFKRIVDDKTLVDIFNQADPAVLGNSLYELLSYIIEFLIGHVHPPELPPNPGSPKFAEISTYILKDILSKNVVLN